MERVVRIAGTFCTAQAGRYHGCLSLVAVAGFLGLFSQAALAAFSPPSRLTVVTDDNYPPYLFRTSDGQLQGILKDKWELWSKVTGVPVNVEGLAWTKAQERVQKGTADVIEALAYTEARTRRYEFSPSYATVEARVFFHRSISGINRVPSMRGFTIGAKDGSACASWLAERGIDTIRRFPTSESLIAAVGAGEIRLFCMDSPTAQYLLFKEKLSDEFRQTAPLYAASFHWAVVRGRTELRDFVQRGFERVPAHALEEVDARWLGSPLKHPVNPRHLFYVAALAAGVLAATALLILWNRTLRMRVAARTTELNGQKQVLETIADGAPLPITLDALTRTVEAQRPGMLCSILLLDPDGVHLRHGAAPSLPEVYTRAIDGSAIGERAGSCGTAAFRREQVVVEDIATDPLWGDYRGLAAGHGLRACWSTPIFDAQRQCLGTFALYFREPRRPTPNDLELIETATHTAAVAISKKREQDALRESEARLRLSVHASNIGLWDWDIAGDHLYFSLEWKSQLGYRDDEISNRFEEWATRLHPEDHEKILPKVKAYLADPVGNYEVEFRLRHKDGSYRWIYARAQVERNAEGRPQRMLGCHIDITERKQAEDELKQSYSRLQELSRRLVESEEAERRNINRELHDRVGQNLSALNLSLNVIRTQLPASSPAGVGERLADAQRLAESAVRQVRDVMADLRPPALDDYGLLAALRTYAEPFAARLGVPIEVIGEELAPRLPPATETAMFRIAQEALTNVAKHARAGSIEVELATDNGRVELSISDDGVGFDLDPAGPQRPSWGLRTMRERAEAVGARLRVESAPQRGTHIVVEVERESV